MQARPQSRKTGIVWMAVKGVSDMIKLSRTRGRRSESIFGDNTSAAKILLAASHLEELGQSPFSAEALIVSAWQKYPRIFGLKGYDEQYPDSNKVLASIMGEKGLARRGWLVKMGQKLYALSHEGRRTVRRLLQGEDQPETIKSDRPIRLSKRQDKLLSSLFVTSAYEKFRQGRKQDLTLTDAFRFWGVTENQSSETIQARLDHLRAELAEIESQVGLGSAGLRDGHSVILDDITMLCDIHNHLLRRFHRHLALLRHKTTQ